MLHDKRRLLLIAGPCSLESESNCRTVATELKALAARHPELNIIFKGSYDKANRTSLGGDRGPGMQAGLDLLAMVKKDYGFDVGGRPPDLAHCCQGVAIEAFSLVPAHA